MIKDELYELAFAYKKTKLWKKLWDDQIFAVRLRDGRIGYISIMGKGGVHCALALYIGATGIKSYQAVVNGSIWEEYVSPLREQELLVQQDCLLCSFETKEFLSDEEQEEVKAYAKAHGHNLSGRNAYPQFEKCEPNRLPWFLESEAEQDLLCEALEAAIEMAKRLEENPYTLHIEGIGPGDWFNDILTLRPEGKTYKTEWTELPDVMFVEYPVPEHFNDILLKKVNNLPKAGSWESEVVNIPHSIQDEPDKAPYFPKIVMSVESNSGYLLPTEPVTDYMEAPEKLMDQYLNSLIGEGRCPKEIWVYDDRSYAFFEGFCERSKVTLRIKDDLDALEEAEHDMLEYFSGEGETEDEEYEMEGLLDLLLLMDEEELAAMPKELRTSLRWLIATQDASESAKKKARAVLDKAEGKIT